MCDPGQTIINLYPFKMLLEESETFLRCSAADS